jgi:hypothetical protein
MLGLNKDVKEGCKKNIFACFDVKLIQYKMLCSWAQQRFDIED